MGSFVIQSSEEEKEELLRIWEECDRNIAKMSRRIGADRSTLYRRLKKAGLDINALRRKHSS
ncbi:MAG: hypothetical protein COV79_01585 [Parcubacteria group bacterium CG11_big_fil_rev_8_21_14_0_20_41_14]|nr:MAG: hypothetical protein COV79_01585 [Parcubacteria group bacterium CG11_big_fil_rev_8_21_14_0_20_41_14]